MERPKVKALLSHDRVLAEDTDPARELYNQSRFGEIQKDKTIQLSDLESLYLIDKDRLEVLDSKNKEIKFEALLKKFGRRHKNLWQRFVVYRDLRDRGYIVKTALKFGADFRVYDRGIKPGEDHAKWIVYPVNETDHMTWYDFAAKNRVAHSTRKRLLIGIVDEESDCTYYEIRWVRP